MTIRVIGIISILMFIASCEDGPNDSMDCPYCSWAHGFWEAIGGETQITGEIGLICYNWYAIETNTGSDSVSVTWDDGIACTTTAGTMHENRIHIEVGNVKADFEMHSELDATATFRTEDGTYTKNLEKKRDDPSVLCD